MTDFNKTHRPAVHPARRLKKLYLVVDLPSSGTTGTDNRTWTCIIVICLSIQSNLQRTFKLGSRIHFKHYHLGHKLAAKAKSFRNYQNLLVPYSVIETKFFLDRGAICQDDF